MPHYREVLYRSYSENLGRAQDEADERPDSSSFEYLRELLPEDRGAAIADLGCGMGEWLAWMQGLGYTNLLGIDIAVDELAACPDVPTLEGDIVEVLEKNKATFDLFHAKDIFEHLQKQETVDLLLSSQKALRPGGLFLISTFNGQAPFADTTFRGDYSHESSFTPTSMAQVLRATGFEVVFVRGIHSTPDSPSGKARRLIWKAASFMWEKLIVSRHGRGEDNPGVDTFSVAPDLLALARRPK